MPRGFDKPKKYDEPFSITAAAGLVEVSAQTLRHYEKLGIVFPRFDGKTRLYSAQDIKWLRCLRELIHGRKLSIGALKKLIEKAPCREIKNCRYDEYANCLKSSDKRFAGRLGAPTPKRLSSEAAPRSPRKRATGKKRINRT